MKDGQLVSRGSEGRTPNTWSIDLSASYDVFWDDNKITLRADVFNVTNNNKATQFNEDNERHLGYDAHPTSPFGVIKTGEHNPTYGLPTSFQAPRYVRFSVNAEF